MKNPYAAETGARVSSPSGFGLASFVRLLLLTLVLSPWLQLPARAQTWQQALSGNNNAPNENAISQAQATAVDANGNVFVTGYFARSITFGNTLLIAAAGIDVFVAKWDATTHEWAWAISQGGTGTDAGYAITVSGNNVYVTGAFEDGNAQFAGQVLLGSGNRDMFVAKYIDNGTSVSSGWATNSGGTGNDFGYGIAVSGTSVYATGTFAGSAIIAGQLLTATGGQDMFVAKYNDNGTSVANGWVATGGGTGNDQGNGVAASGNNVYVIGNYANGSGRFAGQTLAGAGNNDVFVAKYTDAGASVANGWATTGGGTGADVGQGIAVSGTSVYITGAFTGGSASIAGQALSSAGDQDVFVAKYTDAGTSPTNGWATTGGGTSFDVGYGIAVSGAGVYVTGSFTCGTGANMAGQALTTGVSGLGVFVAKYTDTGTSVAGNWASGGNSDAMTSDIGYGIAVSGTSVYVAAYIDFQTFFGPVPLPGQAGSRLLGLDPATGAWQRWEGPLHGGPSYVQATAVDASGNVFVAGQYFQTIGFGAIRLTSKGNQDVFLAKWDAAAQTWAWATSCGGRNQDQVSGLAVSGNGVYITGTFEGPSSYAGQTLNAAHGGDLFVAKYIDNGNSFSNGWAIRDGGNTSGFSRGNAIAVNGTSVYVTGAFPSSTNTNIAGQAMYGQGGLDVFLAKYIDNGTSASNGWATYDGGTSADQASSIALNGNDIYVTGYFTSAASPASFAGRPLTGAGNRDLFVMKYTDIGTRPANGWAISGGGTGDDLGNGIALSGNSVYIAGSFASTNRATIAGQLLPGAGNNDAFVAKYTDNGTSVAEGWATSSGGTGADAGYGIAASGANVYITGSFMSSANASFAGQALVGTANSQDVFVAKYTDAGTSPANGWATSGGGTGIDVGQSIALSGNSVYVAGQVTSLATFGSITFGNVVRGQSNFLGKVLDTSQPLSTTNPASSGARATQLLAYPNPAHTAVTVRLPGTALAAPLALVDALGRVVRTQPALLPGAETILSLTSLPAGLYMLRCGAFSQRLVVE